MIRIKLKTFLATLAVACLSLTVSTQVAAKAEETEILSSKTIVAGVTENINADKLGQPKQADGYSYNLQYGTFEEILNFSLVKAQNGLGSKEVYGNNNYTSAHINDGLVRVSEGFSLIYTLEVEENYKVTITNPETATLNSYLYPVYLDTFVFDGEYRVNVNSTALPLEAKNLVVQANAISHEVHLQAGDTLYFVISADSMGRSIDKFLPEFHLSQEQYEQDRRFDFVGYKEFKNRAAALQTSLQEYFFSFDASLYSEDNYLKLVVLIEDSIKELDEISFDTDLTEFENTVKQKAEKILTLEEETAALQELKAKRIGELEAYYEQLLQSDYSARGKRELKSALEEGKTALQEAKSTAGVNVAFNSAKSALAKVETGGSGCSASVLPTQLSVAMWAVGVLIIRKKQNKQYK